MMQKNVSLGVSGEEDWARGAAASGSIHQGEDAHDGLLLAPAHLADVLVADDGVEHVDARLGLADGGAGELGGQVA